MHLIGQIYGEKCKANILRHRKTRVIHCTYLQQLNMISTYLLESEDVQVPISICVLHVYD